jgi:hypothetical protein
VEQLKARRLLLLEQSGGPGSGSSAASAAAGGLLLASPAAEDAWQLLLQHPEQADPLTGGPTHAILIAMECLALLNRDAPDNPAFFDIRYPAGYQIELPDIR